MLQLLCDAGAEPEIRDENGWTALHYAAACAAGPEALHFLCELLTDGAIDRQCCEGNTALHVASGCGHVNNVRVLLETAADPHVCNANDQSAYHVALQNHHIQCAVAINDYQSVRVANCVEPPPSPVKESVLSEATDVYTTQEWAIGQEEHSGEGGIWAEGFTEDGHVYYYNTLTGESSWYKPGETQQLETWQPAEYEHEEWRDQGSDDDVDQSHYFSTDGGILGGWTGQQLPLCMIPMVSPLTSLDHPTAASKYESVRRKAREQRKQRRGRRLRRNSALEPSSFERLGLNEQGERNERR
ncbi:hypothetical protein BBJ28_00019501 [Nothophytophthora sp. Chile5]|nr:hypothetical protein BBJ28_00019501 [Nothophytophthora sp. Chile5]